MVELAGQTLGHYRLVEKIGAGGMGEVYRARDERLERDVAIKVLPEGVARDAERLARFDREAKLLASLNHQNIATLCGLEERSGVKFLAMELAEGETIAVSNRTESGAPRVWIIDIDRDSRGRLTHDRTSILPTWTPDGRQGEFGRELSTASQSQPSEELVARR